jgi:hypothetical protein
MIRFRSRIEAQDLKYRVEKSSDLVSWLELDNPEGEILDNGDGTQMVTHADTALVSENNEAFLRVVIELLTP